MEVVLGALPSLLPKLAELLAGEYNLQKGVKGRIRFLQAELKTMKAALDDIAPPNHLTSQDRIWARDVRELSYDIEDSIDAFMVQVKGSEQAEKHGFSKFIDKILASLTQARIRRKIATNIKDINDRVKEVQKRCRRYDVDCINNHVHKRLKVDPRDLVRYEDVKKLVGIDEAREEVIRLLIEGNEVSKHHDKIVSIVGLGGLGKTTLANVVYEELRAQFDCSAFVSVSPTPDVEKLFKDMFYQVAKNKAASTGTINVINELREFLQEKRYFIIIDDIWEISYWNMIRCALPDDSDGYRIIATTRILTIAEQIGVAYKMKSLSIENSRILMYGRIFGKEDKENCVYVDAQLAQVSDRILKKCAGVPLAIITIASLLARKGRTQLEWYDVYKSIGAGLEENNTIENMRKVLSLSYYDMPSHLRTCMLYFSMFPEDYIFFKDALIRLWIAEGFIQPKKGEMSLFETGESYFYELVNRSMIQPMHDYFNGPVVCCRIHGMVLDLTCSLASEENVVTIWDHVGHSSASKRVRRLSLQNGKSSHGKPEATLSMEHVRSVIVFPPAIDQVPTLENFVVLRVLDLEGCNLSQGYSLEYLGSLHHLRYLGLRFTCIDRLPAEIGSLRFLQTLNLWGNKICSLPSNIVRLTHLMLLCIFGTTRVPKGIRSLTALEELGSLGIRDEYCTDIIEELGHLTELKKLEIVNYTKWNDGLDKSLVESLNKLHKLQYIAVIIRSGGEINLDGWVVGP
ncbi:hypothetical protein U9M48_034561 [Paspalum notatum var. saurae]|uniref:Uncharacterized protein n=1 Tax=Paspalum notatum var. saurae TaxID=547442 RepID=A0AAQ3UCG7_PASNO